MTEPAQTDRLDQLISEMEECFKIYKYEEILEALKKRGYNSLDDLKAESQKEYLRKILKDLST